MRIAIVHNDYGKFSGEEAVVEAHGRLLRRQGIDVVEFRRSSAELTGLRGNVTGFASGLWNPWSVRNFEQFLDRERPDILHIHNLYPLITPGILPVAKRRGVKIVMTVHNFRLFCPNGLFLHNGKICEKCADQKSILPCLHQNCLEHPVKTLGYALRTRIAQWRQYYLNHVDRFLCLTGFQRDKLISCGLPAERCVIVPNFIENIPTDASAPVPPSRDYVLYMGRLSFEKGIDRLLTAAANLPEIPFRVAGNGAESYRNSAPKNVEFTGFVSGEKQREMLRNARFQIMTSRCYENFPTTLLAGFACNLPALVPQLGAMPEIVGSAGLTFEEDPTDQIRQMWYDDTLYRQLCANTPLQLANYDENKVFKILIDIYREL